MPTLSCIPRSRGLARAATRVGLVLACAVFGAPAVAQEADLFGLGEDEGDDVASVPMVIGLRPASATVLTGEDLLRQGYRTLGDALADVVGIDLQRTTQERRYGLRGIPDGILLVIDGVPTLVDGERDVLDVDEGLDLNDVERVEVIRGPSSAVHGVASLSGVVQVTTRRPGLTSARLRLGTTHLGEREVSADGTVRYDVAALRASVLHREGPNGVWRLENVPTRFIRVGRAVVPSTKENTEIIPQDDSTTHLRLTGSIGALQLDGRFSRSDVHTPISSFSHGLLSTGPQQRQLRERQRMQLSWNRHLGPLFVETSAYGARNLRTDLIVLYPSRGLFPTGGSVTVDSEADTAGLLLTAGVPVLRDHRLLLTCFGDLTRQWAVTRAVDPEEERVYPRLVEFDELTGTATAAFEYQGDFGAGWHLTAGAAVEWRTGYGAALVPRASLSYLPLSWLALRASYAEGSRTPDRYDLALLTQAVIAGRAIGAGVNPDLQPEHARSLELALRLEPSAQLHAELDLFASRHENAIEPEIVGARMVPQNLPPRLVLGGELSTEIEAIPTLLHLGAGVALARTVDGPALENRLLLVTATAEVTPLTGIALGARGRAGWREQSDAASGTSGNAEIFGSYRALDERLSFSLVLRNAIDGQDDSPDVAVLTGTSDVAIPSRGRVLFVAIEGRL
ncbi:MAG: TonB-dependent receptor [Pseudomonadota bacterium]